MEDRGHQGPRRVLDAPQLEQMEVEEIVGQDDGVNLKKKRRNSTKKKGRDSYRGGRQVLKKAKKLPPEAAVKLSPALLISEDGQLPSGYLSAYSQVPQRTVTQRLLFSSKRSLDLRQRLAFAQVAAQRAKQGIDTRLYREAIALWSDLCTKAKVSQSEAVLSLDEQWIEDTEAVARSTQERLENDLATKRAAVQDNKAKDQVVIAFSKLGDFLLARGDGTQALKHFVRMRDFTTTLDQTAQVCRTVAACAAIVGNWTQVSAYVSKAQMLIESRTNASTAQLTESPLPPLLTQSTPPPVSTPSSAWLEIASAFAFLDAKQYDHCAKKLVSVLGAKTDSTTSKETTQLGGLNHPLSEDHNTQTHNTHAWELCAWPDVAAYACFTAVAALGRPELRSLCAEHARFKNRVKQVNPKALEALFFVHNGKYKQALSALALLRDEMLLDPIFATHATPVYEMCADRCIAQFCAPYAVVSLESAAEALGTHEVKALENKLCKLIARGKLHAKIDAAKGVLVTCNHAEIATNDALVTHNVLRSGDKYLREIDALLLRLSCLEHDFLVRGHFHSSSENTAGNGGPDPHSTRGKASDAKASSSRRDSTRLDPSSFFHRGQQQVDAQLNEFSMIDTNMPDNDDLMADESLS